MRQHTLVIAVLLPAFAANAQIYQWKDASGRTVLSDKPAVGQTTQPRAIESAPPPNSATEPQKALADRELEFRKRQKEAQEKNDKAQKEAAAAADKTRNCEDARSNLRALESGERIALRDEKGERYFLEDAQREQQAAKMRQFIQAHCQ